MCKSHLSFLLNGLRACRCIGLLLISLFVLAGCQSAVRTSIITYANPALATTPGSIKVVPAAGLQDNLEFKHFKKGMEARLAKQGYQPTDADNAEFRAELNYAVSRQEKNNPRSRVMLGGHLGYYSHHPGGAVLITDDGGREYEYVREVSFAISKSAATKKAETQSSENKTPVEPANEIVRVNASSTGSCQYLTVVYDEMLDAIFSNLMRPDGSVVNLRVKGETRCP